MAKIDYARNEANTLSMHTTSKKCYRGATMTDALTQFRIVAVAEGLSYVVLVFIGMPLKYMAGQPATVEIVGWIHGLLFVLYVILGTLAWAEEEWSRRFAGWAFAASLVPGGTFWLEHELRKQNRPDPSTSDDS